MPLAKFPPDVRNKDGRGGRCLDCRRRYWLRGDRWHVEYEAGRRCIVPGCITILERLNAGPRCHAHEQQLETERIAAINARAERERDEQLEQLQRIERETVLVELMEQRAA